MNTDNTCQATSEAPYCCDCAVCRAEFAAEQAAEMAAERRNEEALYGIADYSGEPDWAL